MKDQAQQRMAQGSRLAMERDTNKRTKEEMSAQEQQTLEDYENPFKLRKQYNEACAKRLPTFRGKLL